jgi:multiple antibiotic resistance protein
METQMTTLSAGIMLFLIMDPLGNIPFFLSLLKDVPPKRRRVVMVRELLIALGVLLGFLFGGQHILELLQLKADSPWQRCCC